MNAGQRRAHRWLVAGAALVAPTLLGLGLAVAPRPRPPIARPLPSWRAEWRHGTPVGLLRLPVESGGPVIELIGLGEVDVPDPMVFLSPTPPTGTSLPAGSVRLERLVPGRPLSPVRVPPDARGELVLYSGARRAVFDSTTIDMTSGRP